MQWIERMELIGGVPTPIIIDSNGVRSNGTAADLSKAGRVPGGYLLGDIDDADLASLERVEGSSYRTAVGLNVGAEGHHIYALEHEGETIYIPASVLLRTFLGASRHIAASLLLPTGLDRDVVPLSKDGRLTISIGRMNFARTQLTRQLQERLLWFSCFPSARRMWASVYQHAVQGCVGLTPANARFSATVRGLRKGNDLFVTGLQLRSLTPCEEPLPFASSLKHKTFDLELIPEATKSRMKKLHSQESFDVPRLNGSWRTDDGEWTEAGRLLKAQGFQFNRAAKESIDAALEKWGTGSSWQSQGSGAFKRAVKTYHMWKKRGQWDAFKAILKELRSPQSGRNPGPVASSGP